MEISDVRSIELDRTRPFKHRVLFLDNNGNILDQVPVQEDKGWEQFKLIYEAWCKHPGFNPEPPTEEELQRKRK